MCLRERIQQEHYNEINIFKNIAVFSLNLGWQRSNKKSKSSVCTEESNNWLLKNGQYSYEKIPNLKNAIHVQLTFTRVDGLSYHHFDAESSAIIFLEENTNVTALSPKFYFPIYIHVHKM